MGGSGICRAAVDSGVQLRTGESHLQVWLRRIILHLREGDAQRGAARTLPEIKMCVNSLFQLQVSVVRPHTLSSRQQQVSQCRMIDELQQLSYGSYGAPD